MTAAGSLLRLLVLHGLRLKGMAGPATVAAMWELDPDQVEAELAACRDEGLVVERTGERAGWLLTTAGRAAGENLLAWELDRQEARGSAEACYARFLELNPRLLAICTRWQVRQPDPPVLNDHQDPAYDAAVIDDLIELDEEMGSVCGALCTELTRFSRYRPALTAALDRLRQGENDWLTKPTILSYHTLIFELHEDLLATLGLERAAETARLQGSVDAATDGSGSQDPRPQDDPSRESRNESHEHSQEER